MRFLEKKLVCGALILGATIFGALGATNAQALEISIDNQTDAQAAFAFSYLEAKSGKWMTEGWFNATAKSFKKLNLPSDNAIYYIYAEFSNGKRIEGGEGAVELKVSNRSFVCEQDVGPTGTSRQVSFLRARANGGKAVIRVK